MSNIYMDKFLNITEPEVAYFLGLFWADGYIWRSKKINTCIISLGLIEKDFKLVKKHIKKLGNWNFSTYQPPGKNNQVVTKAYMADMEFYNFLYDHGYDEKSGGSPDRILSKIPEELKCYWYRGLIDGDGCIHVYTENSTIKVDIASTYDQDWDFIKNFCNSNNIIFRISRRILKSGKYSIFTISQGPSVLRFLRYIYKNVKIDKICFPRKYKKYLKIEKFYNGKKIKDLPIDNNGKIILEDLSSKKFSLLTVLREDKRDRHGHRRWLCSCECGNTLVVDGGSLKHGDTKSCGCYINYEAREKTGKLFSIINKKHGSVGTKFYQMWARIKSRYLSRNIHKLDYPFQLSWKNFKQFKKDNYDEFIKISENETKFVKILRRDTKKGFIKGNVYFKLHKRRASENETLVKNGKDQLIQEIKS